MATSSGFCLYLRTLSTSYSYLRCVSNNILPNIFVKKCLPEKKLPSKAFRSKTFPKTQARIQILGDNHKIKKSKKPISSNNKKDHNYESTKKPLGKQTIEKILEDFGCNTSKTISQENDLCHPPKPKTSTPPNTG